MKDFANIARPLHRLTERGAVFCWSKECQEAFLKLRRCLVTTSVLAYPDFSRRFTLDTDASDTGIGAVLSQLDTDSRKRVVCYASCAFSKPERNHCMTKWELLAVVCFTKQFRPFLLGRRFTLRTDHGSLTWLTNFKEPEGQVARLLECLQEFDFEVVHRRGRQHTNADALLHRPCEQCGHNNTEPDICVFDLWVSQDTNQIRQSQLHDDLSASS